MSDTNVNKMISRISSLLDWTTRHGYTDKNYATKLRKKVATKQKASEIRQELTVDDLQKLFNLWLANC